MRVASLLSHLGNDQKRWRRINKLDFQRRPFRYLVPPPLIPLSGGCGIRGAQQGADFHVPCHELLTLLAERSAFLVDLFCGKATKKKPPFCKHSERSMGAKRC